MSLHDAIEHYHSLLDDDIAAEVTDLGNYFVSSAGRDVFEVLEGALAAAARKNIDAVIE